MQTVATLPEVKRRGYLMYDDPAPVANTYRQLCQQKQHPVVSIRPDGKAWLVTLDISTTGHGLNAVGVQVLQQLAFRMGSVTPTNDGTLRAYSLNTATTVAKRLVSIGRDKRFWSR